MEHFTDKLVSNYLAEGQLSLPIYCGGSVVIDEDEHKVYSIDLPTFSAWAVGQKISEKPADLLRKFIEEKIANGTLYTEAAMNGYLHSKRLQLFLNSNIAEHFVVKVLGGKLLDGNDELTLDSEAIIGEDGCAKADVVVDGVEVEVKVTHNNDTAANVLAKAHKKPIVVIYIISPVLASHWYIYVRQEDGSYVKVSESPTNELETKALAWQEALRNEAPVLPLVYLKDEPDGSLSVSKMWQR